MRFGHVFVNGHLTTFDVSMELVGGHHVYVAALSENPAVRFLGVHPELAVDRLKQHLAQAANAPAPVWSRQHASSARR